MFRSMTIKCCKNNHVFSLRGIYQYTYEWLNVYSLNYKMNSVDHSYNAWKGDGNFSCWRKKMNLTRPRNNRSRSYGSQNYIHIVNDILSLCVNTLHLSATYFFCKLRFLLNFCIFPSTNIQNVPVTSAILVWLCKWCPG